MDKTKKSDAQQEKYSVEQVATALEVSAGVISLAAQKLNCSRTTIYRYMELYPELRALRVDVEEQTKDLAESQLIVKIKDGNMAAIIFFLKTKAKDRGYIERMEQTGKGGGPIEHQFKLEDMSDEDLNDLERILANAGTSSRGDPATPEYPKH